MLKQERYDTMLNLHFLTYFITVFEQSCAGSNNVYNLILCLILFHFCIWMYKSEAHFVIFLAYITSFVVLGFRPKANLVSCKHLNQLHLENSSHILQSLASLLMTVSYLRYKLSNIFRIVAMLHTTLFWLWFPIGQVILKCVVDHTWQYTSAFLNYESFHCH